MIDAGVPVTPLDLPTAMSASILAAYSCLSYAALNFALSTPACAAHCSKFSGVRAFMFAKARSWNFQKAFEPPSRKTVSAATDAGRAFLWNGSGLFFQMTRSFSGPYFSLSCVMVVSTLWQNGHSKSLNTTMVTGAVRAPHVGSFDETGTLAASSFQGVPSEYSLTADAAVPWAPAPPRSIPHISPIPAKKQRKKPTMAVPLFIVHSSFRNGCRPGASLA